MVLWRDFEGFLGILVQVLYIGRMSPRSGANLVLDGVQHLNIQQLKLKIQRKIYQLHAFPNFLKNLPLSQYNMLIKISSSLKNN